MYLVIILFLTFFFLCGMKLYKESKLVEIDKVIVGLSVNEMEERLGQDLGYGWRLGKFVPTNEYLIPNSTGKTEVLYGVKNAWTPHVSPYIVFRHYV